MQKKLSSIIIDNIFLIIATFLVCFVWVRYHVHNNILILVYSSILTFVICSIFHIFYQKKQKKLNFNKKERKNIENLTFFLIFLSQEDKIKYFKNALKSKGLNVTNQNNFLVFNDYILSINYSTTCSNQNNIIETIIKISSGNFNKQNIIICSPSFNDEAIKLVKKIYQYKIILLDEKDVYNKLFKQLNLQTEHIKNKLTKKQKVFDLLNIAFNRKRFKGYLISALILLISSYFLRYNIYYLIFSTILSFFAVFSYFNNFFNKKTTDIFENTNSLDKKEN